MAYAFRLEDPRVVHIRLGRADLGGEGLGLFLRLGGRERALPRAALRGDTISLVDELLDVERALQLSATEIPHVVIRRAGVAGAVLDEPLFFHHSFFAPVMDYARTFPWSAAGGASRPGRLAVFTHVRDDAAMLRLWVRHYARLAGPANLFVIDHGSAAPVRGLPPPEASVVRLPRGATDHAEMARFCGGFQRFLLSQYRWVLHTDVDELLVHQGGEAAFSAVLEGEGGVLAPQYAVDVLHDIRREGALRPDEPIGPQRSVMLPAGDLYRKPALADEPASWLQGFHQVYEQARVRGVPGLWLLHLAAADFETLLARNRRWNAARQTVDDRRISPQARPADAESLRAWYAARLADARLTLIPPELRGQF